jgi:hypothetical protein
MHVWKGEKSLVGRHYVSVRLLSGAKFAFLRRAVNRWRPRRDDLAGGAIHLERRAVFGSDRECTAQPILMHGEFCTLQEW